MNKKKTVLPIALFIILALYPAAIFSNNCTSLEPLHWLLGAWEAEGSKNTVIESWRKISSHTFEGLGETRSKINNKVISKESLRLLEMSGNVFYLAKVGHNKLPVAFKLVECGKGYAFFENNTHDFPKRLEYRKQGENEMVVSVKGSKGKSFKIKFKKKTNK
jgi:Domain of unknown function (DUF6265)